jgi:prepilin signal peptidase PulO-like enzyme (type II secretory pathway)
MNTVFLFLIGLCVGSFLNVVITRTKEGRSWGKGRSACVVCHTRLRACELIPLFSYLCLRGKCGHCRAPISVQYPLVELATGVGFLLIHLRYVFGFSLPETFTEEMFLWFYLRDMLSWCVMILIAVYDFRFGLIPDRFTLPALLFLFPLQIFLGVSWGSLVTGALVIGGFFAAQYVLSRGTWVGGGDMRLGVLMGVMLGLSQGLFALFIAYLIGAMIGVFLLITKKATRKTRLPLGPFLAGASLLVLLSGDWLMVFFDITV